MKLHVLGSESSGNSYILQAESSCLLIEAGVPLMEVKKSLNFDISRIAGCVVSHAHLDHAKYVKEYRQYGIPVHTDHKDGGMIQIDGFKVKSFPVVHDVPCYGFVISHHEMGNAVFITDSQYSPFKFSCINHWFVEANFDQEIIDDLVLNGKIEPFVRQRIMNSHMSLQTVKELLKANDLSHARNIVLLHLSAGNSDAAKFKSEIEGLTGVNTTIADKGITIDLNKNIF